MRNEKAAGSTGNGASGDDQNHQPSEVYIARTSGGAAVGTFSQDAGGRWCCIKRVNSTRHRLRRPSPAWACDRGILDRLRTLGGDDAELELHDEADGSIWRAPLRRFDQHGQDFHLGHGLQRRLPVECWTVVRSDGSSSDGVEQLPLFNIDGGAP